jgi:hypothetical protein
MAASPEDSASLEGSASPGASASPGGSELLHVSHAVARDQVIRILGTALEQGRLTDGEHDERVAKVPVSTCLADLEALIADLPAGLAGHPPAARDVWTGVGLIIAAAGVIVAIVLSQPDNYLAFMAFLGAAATLILVPAITVGLMFDVRHQKRLRGHR